MSTAQIALLLEEPYSYDGTFAGTGHTAVYLSRICAESPTRLRHCGPGEKGVVISRYHGVAGKDWLAIPLIPYLYAVNDSENVPLYVDTKLVALLRERYLATLPIPGEPHPGVEPRYELAGSAYDRTLYGFRINTRPDQDEALIRWLNGAPNRESYTLLKRNCADFVKQIVNFYYPHAIHRSIIADVGVTTPKQAAKSLVRYSRRHPEMQLTTFVIPQVPGLKRSKPVHGVIESLVLAKKYVTPVLLFHPVVVGAVETAYWAGWRFNPAKDAFIFDASTADPISDLGRSLTSSQKHSYEELVAGVRKEHELDRLANWRAIQSSSTPEIDAQGGPFLNVPLEGGEVPIGICPANAARMSDSPALSEELVLSRLAVELKSKKPSLSEQLVRGDWKLLESVRGASRAELAQREQGTH